MLWLHARDDVELGKAADLGGVGTLDVLDAMPSRARGGLECVERLPDRRVADCVHLHLPSALARDERMPRQLVAGPQWGSAIISVAFIRIEHRRGLRLDDSVGEGFDDPAPDPYVARPRARDLLICVEPPPPFDLVNARRHVERKAHAERQVTGVAQRIPEAELVPAVTRFLRRGDAARRSHLHAGAQSVQLFLRRSRWDVPGHHVHRRLFQDASLGHPRDRERRAVGPAGVRVERLEVGGTVGDEAVEQLDGRHPAGERRVEPAATDDPAVGASAHVVGDALFEVGLARDAEQVQLAQRPRAHQEVDVGVVEGRHDRAAAGVDDSRVLINVRANLSVGADRGDALFRAGHGRCRLLAGPPDDAVDERQIHA